MKVFGRVNIYRKFLGNRNDKITISKRKLIGYVLGVGELREKSMKLEA